MEVRTDTTPGFFSRNTAGATRAADCLIKDSHSRRAAGSFAEQGRVRVVVSSGHIHLAVKYRQTTDADTNPIKGS